MVLIGDTHTPQTESLPVARAKAQNAVTWLLFVNATVFTAFLAVLEVLK